MTITDTNVVLVADQTKCKSSVNTKRSLDRTINATDCVISSWILWDCLFFFNIICSVESKQPQQIQHFYCQQEKSTLIWLGGKKNCCVDLKICEKLLIFQHASLHLYLHLFFCILVYGWLLLWLGGHSDFSLGASLDTDMCLCRELLMLHWRIWLSLPAKPHHGRFAGSLIVSNSFCWLKFLPSRNRDPLKSQT